MANLVKYNNFDISTICGHDPFVGVSDEPIIVGGKFKTLKRITIQGKILPTCGNSTDITNKIKQLIDAFRFDFKTLEAGNIILEYAKVESVDVTQSNFFATADFTVTLSGYPLGLSENPFHQYNILEPVDEKQITENDDGTINITRRISVKGISTNVSAIQNARNFINNYYGQSYKQIPDIFFPIGQLTSPGVNNINLKPRRLVETINRMEGTISIDIDFVYRNNAQNNNNVLTYSVDVGYDDRSGIYNATINGNITASDVENNSTTIRTNLNNSLKSLDFFTLTLNIFRSLTGFNYLNPEPESFSIKEDIENNTITFTYAYVSDPYPVKTNISYDVQYDNVRDITNVSISATLTARGSQKNKTSLLEAELAKLNLYSLAQSYFSRYAITKTPRLNQNPASYNITRNKFENTTTSIQVSADYSNQYEEENGLIKFEYTLSASPSIDVYLPIQFLDGSNGIFNMNFYKRGTVSIQGSALGKNAGLGPTIRNLAISKLNSFASSIGATIKVRTEDNITSPLKSDDGYTYSFNITENCETRKY